MSPAFSYTGLKLRGSSLVDGAESAFEPNIREADQFMREIDHMSACIATGTQPHTGGAEGLQDMNIVAAIYSAAKTGRPVALALPKGPTRGPAAIWRGVQHALIGGSAPVRAPIADNRPRKNGLDRVGHRPIHAKNRALDAWPR